MINIGAYRSTLEYREILRILQKASTEGKNFFWQTSESGRIVQPIEHFEIDFVTREIVVFFNNPQVKITKDLTLYVKLDYKESVFKTTDFKVGNKTLQFTFPKEVKALEMRADLRHTFKAEQGKTITVKPMLNNAINDTMTELTIRAQDISSQGMGLLISENNRPFLKNNRILWVTKLHDVPLDHPVLAEVVYMNSDGTKNKELKVGLKLSGIINDAAFNQFVQ